VLAYQQTVLNGQQEAENGLVTFLKGRKRFEAQAKSVAAVEQAEKIVVAQFDAGTITISQLILFEQNLVQQQDTLALAQGEIALGLIQVYKALGGGWQLRNTGCCPSGQFAAPAPEVTPTPVLPAAHRRPMLGPPS
jgi:outer membrane protein TolC